MITTLEESVQQVHEQMAQQKSRLLAEKEQQSRQTAKQLEAIQASIQQQLAAREAEVREELRAVVIQKERAVVQANEKVVTANTHTHTVVEHAEIFIVSFLNNCMEQASSSTISPMHGHTCTVCSW